MYDTPYSERMRNMRVALETVGLSALGLLASVGIWAITSTLIDLSTPRTVDPDLAMFGVEILWTSDERNCGAQEDPHGYGGCFRRDTPGVIYVSPGMDKASTHAIIAHEVGHAVHFRLGLEADECMADKFALSIGANPDMLHNCP